MKLELIDWKAADKASEDAIRQSLLTQACNQLVMDRAKKEIKLLGGKTSEEEQEDVRKSNSTNSS